MLRERSTSTVTRVSDAGRARSRTGIASNHTSASHAIARSAVNVRRASGGSGGRRKVYAHHASSTSISETRTSHGHGALGAR
jgi:hypothetical protein